MINELVKQRIAEKLANYVARFESQNKAANSLKNVSAATVNHMVNGKWNLIKDSMWLNIGSQIGYSENEWEIVETRCFKMISAILQDAQENKLVMALKGKEGSGKTEAIKQYCATHKEAYLVKCKSYWSCKYFLVELMLSLGLDSGGLNVYEMMQSITSFLRSKKSPILILDELDKVTDNVLFFFISLFNDLEHHCSLVVSATEFLEKRIKRGVLLNKKGYREIYSRLGRKFIELPGINNTDIMQVCVANGFNDQKSIKIIIEDSEYDLRRVRRKIHALKNVA